jgi:hypothetical protein
VAKRGGEFLLVDRRSDVVGNRRSEDRYALDEVNHLPPHFPAMHRGHAGQIDHEIRAEVGEAGVDVALVERTKALHTSAMLSAVVDLLCGHRPASGLP